MKAYLDTLRTILETGVKSDDRTGTGTLSLFGLQYRHDLNKGFPLLTTKKMPLKTIATELEWFLKGRTDNQWLNQHGVHIWDEWATAEQCDKFGRKEGSLGPVYGHQWRNFGARELVFINLGDDDYEKNGFDQIAWVVNEIKTNPNSRRLIVSGWNPKEAGRVALPPCHTLFQFYVRNGRLSCQLYQRSADFFLGVPFNLASYSLLTHAIAKVCDLGVGDFVHTFGDCHIYLNHLDQVKEQLGREPRALPELGICGLGDIDLFNAGMVKVEGYDPHPAIKAPVAI